MSYPQRLPIVNSDDGTWGYILRQFLMKEHYNDDTDNPVNGGHQNVTIRAGSTSAAPLTFTSGTLMSTAAAGSMEFNTDKLYFTITTGTVRKTIAMYDDSSGAAGDTYYRTSGGAFNRLAVGTGNQVLGVSGGLPEWVTPSNSTYSTATKTSNYTVTTSDAIILANANTGNVTITLPLASGCAGYQFTVKRIDSSAHTCSLVPSGSDTIDGNASVTFAVQYVSLNLISNGSNWYIV